MTPTAQAACRVANAKRLRRKDATDIAIETIEAIAEWGCAVILFLLPTGEVRRARAHGKLARHYSRCWPDGEVGTYDGAANVAQIAADVIECERVL